MEKNRREMQKYKIIEYLLKYLNLLLIRTKLEDSNIFFLFKRLLHPPPIQVLPI